MTRDELIFKLNNIRMELNDGQHIDIQSEIVEIIHSLRSEPCTDAISRKEVKELLDEYYAELTLDETALKSNAIAIKVTRHIINDIEALPSVNPTKTEDIVEEFENEDWTL